jgi:rRNA-processing protein EBP2
LKDWRLTFDYFLFITDHMAMVKDRLIFENKKIDAVSQRKSNKEQKLRSKESAANKVAEKLKRKKDHFKELDDWAQNAKSNRGGEEGGDKPFNKKRMAADKKYGHGGKKGRFKQSSSESKQDVSGFNPRGNFAGGQKKTSGGGGSGAGASRQGKRARDAGRSRK